jgi:hypothetical protein
VSGNERRTTNDMNDASPSLGFGLGRTLLRSASTSSAPCCARHTCAAAAGPAQRSKGARSAWRMATGASSDSAQRSKWVKR